MRKKDRLQFNSSQIARLRLLNLLLMLIIFVMLGFAFDWHRSHKQLALVSLDRHYKGELASTRSHIESTLASEEQRLASRADYATSGTLPSEKPIIEADEVQKYLISSKARYLAEAHTPDNDKLLELIERTTQQIQDSEKVNQHLLNHLRGMFYRELHYRHFANKDRKDWKLLPMRFGGFNSKSLSPQKAKTRFQTAEKLLNAGNEFMAMYHFREVAISRPHRQSHVILKIEALLKCLQFEKKYPAETAKLASTDFPDPDNPPKGNARNRKTYRFLKPDAILTYLTHLFHANLSINPEPESVLAFEHRLMEIAPEYQTVREETAKDLALIDSLRKQIDDRDLPLRLYLGDNRFFHASKHNIGLVFELNVSDLLTQHYETSASVDQQIDIKLVTDASIIEDNPYVSHLTTYKDLGIMIPLSVSRAASAAIDQRYQVVNGIIFGLAVMNLCCFLVLMRLLQREHELHSLRTRFLSTVSHELKTPLSLIRLYAESLLLGRVKDEKKQAYLDTILIETDRLNGIVSNIVDFSTVERNQLKLNLAEVSLTETCKGTLEGFKKRFETEHFEVESQISDDITMETDRLVFTQILFNLIDNAMKYSGGKKVIKIILEKVTDQIVLRVCDEGIGIPDKEKPNIFRDFYRVNDENVRARRGSGIGLYLVKQFVNQMNGTVSVQDNDPAGSIFEIRLPAAA